MPSGCLIFVETVANSACTHETLFSLHHTKQCLLVALLPWLGVLWDLTAQHINWKQFQNLMNINHF
jgi:hypothetical protein